jgi:hypothetical protein
MAVSHVLSSPIANMTGTVTVFNSQGSTVTANATEIVRPQDWNSAHNQYMTIAGVILRVLVRYQVQTLYFKVAIT